MNLVLPQLVFYRILIVNPQDFILILILIQSLLKDYLQSSNHEINALFNLKNNCKWPISI
jgi:hypothetical protein